MQKLFYNLGKKVGKSWAQGRYIFASFSGNGEEALQAEYTLGFILSKDIEKEVRVSDNPYEQLLIDSIFNELKKRIKNKDRFFTLKIFESNDLNAFALPGGFIYLSSALIRHLEKDRDALAFVLAHETVHIILRHPLKRIVANYSLNAVSQIFKAGSTLGVLGKDAIKKLLASHYSKARELEADAYGLRLINSAGFDPGGGVRLMQFFRQMDKKDSFSYFSTHPPLSEREIALKRIIRKLNQE